MKSVEGYKGGSGKVDAFYEMAAELTDNGSNVLVFSQFATMLEELNEGLEKEGIKTLILTGSTTKEERRRLVDEFQSQIVPTIFLISLKAGGTGLNLTAADTVIHFYVFSNCLNHICIIKWYMLMFFMMI